MDRGANADRFSLKYAPYLSQYLLPNPLSLTEDKIVDSICRFMRSVKHCTSQDQSACHIVYETKTNAWIAEQRRLFSRAVAKTMRSARILLQASADIADINAASFSFTYFEIFSESEVFKSRQRPELYKCQSHSHRHVLGTILCRHFEIIKMQIYVRNRTCNDSIDVKLNFPIHHKLENSAIVFNRWPISRWHTERMFSKH